MSDFIPQADDSLSTWLSNFKTKIGTYATTLGISAADVTIYQNDCDSLIASVQKVANGKKTYQNLVKEKDELRSDTVGNIRTLSSRIKTHANYTNAIGNDLGIVAAATVIDWATAKPELKLVNNGGHVVISFKKGQSNGIKIYSKRGAEAAFSFLALDTHSPYHDNRPNLVAGTPETRQYYAYFIDSTDEQIGLQSDVASITL